jgi:hypothetical protein
MDFQRLSFLALTAALSLAFSVAVLLATRAHVADGAPIASASVPSVSGVPRAPARIDTAGDVLEVFTNTWSHSSIGLVYAPGRQQIRYVHESQSATSSPTIYDVAYGSHTVLSSFALSAQNSGWPWELDNRTGAGYDYVNDTFFLTDYNGDLIYADDNIVEVDVNGTILNAWEMDDEVGSNDSADGSAIDSIVDIAVVPGRGGNRYFATALYDGPVVYEIALTRTGTWWTPNSWSTVMTYTGGALSDIFTDNMSIDYDAQNNVLYHSGWTTSTILVTDLNMQPITWAPATFNCPNSAGYHSGVTFIEGAWPPEIWSTNYSGANTTTRCEAVGNPPVQPEWQKSVAGQPWDPQGVVVAQVGDALEVIDVITAVQPFTLTETWNPDHLTPLSVDVSPPVATVISTPFSIQVVAPAGPPEVIEIRKWFYVKPSTWVTTTLLEELVVEGGPAFAARPVTIVKQPPQLWLDSAYELEADVGSVVSYTLHYGNNGGYENDVSLSSNFPITAPFVFAAPYPAHVSPDGLAVRWEVGDLAQGDTGTVDVYLFISDTVPASSTVPIWNGVFNHADQLAAETPVAFHARRLPSDVGWEKLVNGEPWYPGIAVTLQTSQTLLVEEFVDPAGNATGFTLVEEWNPAELALLGWEIQPVSYTAYVSTPAPGIWLLEAPPGVDFGALWVAKEFHVEPCTWPESLLWETLAVWEGPTRTRPVAVHKEQPLLWLGAAFDPTVYGGDRTEFVLTYGNHGGRESAFVVHTTLPPEATFVEAQPPPAASGPGWVAWEFPAGLDQDAQGDIVVTVDIAPRLPVSETVEIWNRIANHVGEPVDEDVVAYHVPPPEWQKRIDGALWTSDTGVLVETGDLIAVTDIISTRSSLALVEAWNPGHLELLDVVPEPDLGLLHVEPGAVVWEFPGGVPGTITLTKLFHVQPCTWTYTVLMEELLIGDRLWERRPLHVDKIPSALWIDGLYEPQVLPGQEATFVLSYGNTGGLENRTWISATFPAGVVFVDSTPAPLDVAPDRRWAAWDAGELARDGQGSVAVTVTLDAVLPPGELWIEVEILDHADVVHDRTAIVYVGEQALYLPLVCQAP